MSMYIEDIIKYIKQDEIAKDRLGW